jgi:tetratricopeptide (TPR) repeat protein
MPIISSSSTTPRFSSGRPWGGAGLVAGLVILVTLLSGLCTTQWNPEKTALVSGLSAGAVLLQFDHPFATPAFTVLAAALATAWLARPASEQRPSSHFLPAWVACAFIPVITLAIVFCERDLAARRAFNNALSSDTPDDYVNGLVQAARLAPADPYYPHLLAAHFETGAPFNSHTAPSPGKAVRLLLDSLTVNPDLEYARYNLGWLLLETDPAAAALNFSTAARLAPQRGAVWFGLGLARIRLGDTDGATRAFATEWLLNPSFAWSPVWFAPPLDVLRPRIHTLAGPAASAQNRNIDPWASLSDTPATPLSAYRRLRTGYGVLMGHPQGPPPVDVNVQEKLALPEGVTVPSFGWLDGGFLLDFIDRASR